MMGTANRIIGIVQPTYLPWLPFFERMACSDVFIYLDDVKYSKNSFHNRNAIKGPSGRVMMTVPVLYTGNSTAMINEIRTDNKTEWWVKHWRTIQQCYSKSPYFSRYRNELEELFTHPGERLIQVIMPLIEFLKRELKIQTPCYLSSAIGVTGIRNEKLVNLCRYFDGTHFIVKPGTEDYHPPEDFLPHGVEFHHLHYTAFEYPQLYGAFEPLLSALDFVLNCGQVDFRVMLDQQQRTESQS